MAVGDAAPRQLVVAQISKEVDRRRANRPEFVGEVVDRSLVESSGGDVGVLVEAGHGLAVGTSEAKGTIRENALGVGEMTDDFLYGPLAGCVGVERTLVVDAT